MLSALQNMVLLGAKTHKVVKNLSQDHTYTSHQILSWANLWIIGILSINHILELELWRCKSLGSVDDASSVGEEMGPLWVHPEGSRRKGRYTPVKVSKTQISQMNPEPTACAFQANI